MNADMTAHIGLPMVNLALPIQAIPASISSIWCVRKHAVGAGKKRWQQAGSTYWSVISAMAVVSGRKIT